MANTTTTLVTTTPVMTRSTATTSMATMIGEDGRNCQDSTNIMIPSLKGYDNYNSWSIQMIGCLLSLGVAEAIKQRMDGRKNELAFSKIITSIDQRLIDELHIENESACDLWNLLEEKFRLRKIAQVYQLFDGLLNYKFKYDDIEAK